jgi:CO dehydrogenase/acetyl-CoA synthase gamma subunit (corrinoid Fe-S protein)
MSDYTRQINDVWAILIDTDDGEGLVFAGGQDNLNKYPVPLVTHTDQDLDELINVAEKVAKSSGETLVLYKFSERKLVKTITGTIKH